SDIVLGRLRDGEFDGDVDVGIEQGLERIAAAEGGDEVDSFGLVDRLDGVGSHASLGSDDGCANAHVLCLLARRSPQDSLATARSPPRILSCSRPLDTSDLNSAEAPSSVHPKARARDARVCAEPGADLGVEADAVVEQFLPLTAFDEEAGVLRHLRRGGVVRAVAQLEPMDAEAIVQMV